eukprot:scaffold82496_cov29-Tisochrysis_lutea.AAC.12
MPRAAMHACVRSRRIILVHHFTFIASLGICTTPGSIGSRRALIGRWRRAKEPGPSVCGRYAGDDRSTSRLARAPPSLNICWRCETHIYASGLTSPRPAQTCRRARRARRTPPQAAPSPRTGPKWTLHDQALHVISPPLSAMLRAPAHTRES